MVRYIWALCLWAVLSGPAMPHGFAGLAQVDPETSSITDERRGLRVDLTLSQVIPWRVFTLDGPPRLVLDFREVNWRGMGRDKLEAAAGAEAVAFGAVQPGWSRLIVTLSEPMAVIEAGMKEDTPGGTARVTILLRHTDAESFAAGAGAPPDHDYRLDASDAPPFEGPGRLDRPLVVAIDPGHGGIDPGAERDGTREAHLMLSLARELSDALLRDGRFDVILTRYADEFVPLTERITRARASGAHVFLSLHADALAEGHARGATVYLLSEEASDEASAKMAVRHSAADLLVGLDLSGQGDQVATALQDLLRRENEPRAEALARTIVAAFETGGVPINSRPLRAGDIAVLRAADMPSLLIEVGFLSDDTDLARLRSAEGRSKIVAALVAALSDWEQADAAAAAMVRQ